MSLTTSSTWCSLNRKITKIFCTTTTQHAAYQAQSKCALSQQTATAAINSSNDKDCIRQHHVVGGGHLADHTQSFFLVALAICTPWVKKRDTILLSISLLNIDRFSQFFHRRTQLELCNKLLIKIPPHLRCVATLSCEMLKNRKLATIWIKYLV